MYPLPGPGKWELEAHKASRPTKHRVVMPTKAVPTATHMMFVKLYQEGTVKAVISQNTDGLHRRSGLPENGTVTIISIVIGSVPHLYNIGFTPRPYNTSSTQVSMQH